jgi:hypothetical protein
MLYRAVSTAWRAIITAHRKSQRCLARICPADIALGISMLMH